VNDPSKSTDSRILAKLLAGFFAALFILSTIVVTLTFFPSRQLLNPDFYKQTLADQGIYQRLPEFLAEQLASNITQDNCLQTPGSPQCQTEDGSRAQNDRPVYLLILDQGEWESILVNIIDPVWLQTQTETIIDQFFDVLLTSEDPTNAPILISLSELKKRLAGPQGTQAFLLILEAQTPCSIEQLLGLLQLGLGMPTSIESMLCRPPEYVLSELTPVIEIFLSRAVAQVPDQIPINLPDSLTGNPESTNSQESSITFKSNPIQILRGTRTVISLSPLLPLVLISLVTIFAVRSVRDFLLWWGISFLAAGTITLLLAIILFPTTNWALAQVLPEETGIFPGITNLLGELGVLNVLNELASRLLNSILIPAGVITFIGLLLLLGLLFVKDHTSPQQNSKQIEPNDPNH
jgi:hypothetical protein